MTEESHYEDFTVFKEIKSIDVLLNNERYNICEITKDCDIIESTKRINSEMRFNEQIFTVLEEAKKINFVSYYILIPFVDCILKCNSIYVKFFCVTSPIDGSKV